jgi:hypothetical protein
MGEVALVDRGTLPFALCHGFRHVDGVPDDDGMGHQIEAPGWLDQFFATYAPQVFHFVSNFSGTAHGGVAKRTIPLLRQSIATEVLLPRDPIETDKNYGLEVRQQYPPVCCPWPPRSHGRSMYGQCPEGTGSVTSRVGPPGAMAVLPCVV